MIRRTAATLACTLPFLGSCSPETVAQLEDEVIATSAAPPDGARPVSDYKDERKRAALLGLAYESGRAVLVPEEARRLVAGPDAAASAREARLAEELTRENRILEAVAARTRAVLLAPEDARRYLELGDTLLLPKGWDDKAEAAYRTSLDLDPSDPDAHARLGNVLWRAGERDAAIAALSEAVRLEPGHGAAHKLLAKIHFLLREDAGAWREIHLAERAGEAIPPQMRAQLASRSPEPERRTDR